MKQKDAFTRKAKKEGFRARSIYKLEQINKRFNLIRKTDSVLDLGSSPGSWLQFLSKYTQGFILGIDIQPVNPIPNTHFLNASITEKETINKIKEVYPGKFDAVISDAAPSTTGIKHLDHERSYDICKSAFLIAKACLKSRGNFLCKMYESHLTPTLISELRPFFFSVKAFRPQTTKKRSNEVFIIGKGLKLE